MTLPGALAALLVFADTVQAGNPLLLDTMKHELDREFAALSKAPDHPAYYLSYLVIESGSFRATGAWGGLTQSQRSLDRFLDLDLRVGSPALDNTHRNTQDFGAFSVPLGPDAGSLRADLWLETQRRYREAVERFIKIEADHAIKVKEEDPSPDFAAAPKAAYAEDAAPVSVSGSTWEDIVRRVSAEFRKFPSVLECNVQFQARTQARWFANSEGAAIAQSRPVLEVSVWAHSRGEDGMDFALYRPFYGRTEADLPPEADLAREAGEVGRLLTALRDAPLVDPFVGPAILSGRAAAVLFHEVLGHRLEGHRQKDEQADQTFTMQLGKRILPEFLSVVSDPTRESLGRTALMGFYRYDDEGVKAERVTLVDRGVLKAFMMSRSPVRGFPASNGHGRKQAGKSAVSRQSSLLVEAAKTVPAAALRRDLVARLKKLGKPYGLLFDDIEGGFTFTGRTIPNAFNVMPVVVYRVFADGRPDELVRGVDLIGTPLSTLDRIVAAGDDMGVFNGYCGAESGYVPVAAACPSLLVSEVEVQRKQKGQERPPLLPAPEWK